MKERSRKLKDVQYYLKTQRKEKREFPREQSRGGGGGHPPKKTKTALIYIHINRLPSGSVVKHPLADARKVGSFPGQEDLLEEEIATHSSVLIQSGAWQATAHEVAKSEKPLSD